jgi:hypothetical protein
MPPRRNKKNLSDNVVNLQSYFPKKRPPLTITEVDLRIREFTDWIIRGLGPRGIRCEIEEIEAMLYGLSPCYSYGPWWSVQRLGRHLAADCGLQCHPEVAVQHLLRRYVAFVRVAREQLGIGEMWWLLTHTAYDGLMGDLSPQPWPVAAPEGVLAELPAPQGAPEERACADR